MSIIDDYAGIARSLREKQGLLKPKSVRNEPQPAAQQAAQNQLGIQAADPGHSHQYQQAAPWQPGQPGCGFCSDAGWVGVKRNDLWVAVHCPACNNPMRKKSPLP